MTAILFAMLMQAASPVPMRAVAKGVVSQVDAPRQVVVRTAEEWARLWSGQSLDATTPPAVDFSKEMVVAVYLGSRPTAGYSVDIASVGEEGGKIVVKYRETKPQRGMMLAQIITSPFAVVAVPKAAGEVTFEKVE